jgi:hypothetical protein
MICVLPVAITRVDGEQGCVGALGRDGAWVRPGPVQLTELTAESPCYSYDRWIWIDAAPCSEKDARPEDRRLVGAPRSGDSIDSADRAALLHAHADPSVEAAFACGRSLGAVCARVHRVYLRRSTGGRDFVRMDFEDDAGVKYDFIVPDLHFERWARARLEEDATSALATRKVLLALGLTKPNDRFPGRFGGCHPLVVGVHTASERAS